MPTLKSPLEVRRPIFTGSRVVFDGGYQSVTLPAEEEYITVDEPAGDGLQFIVADRIGYLVSKHSLAEATAP